MPVHADSEKQFELALELLRRVMVLHERVPHQQVVIAIDQLCVPWNHEALHNKVLSWKIDFFRKTARLLDPSETNRGRQQLSLALRHLLGRHEDAQLSRLYAIIEAYRVLEPSPSRVDA